LTPRAGELLRRELDRGRLTARGFHRIWRVARTLADLAERPGPIDDEFVITALGMRARIGRSAVGRAA
jgi:magnesium chelatase family protein